MLIPIVHLSLTNLSSLPRQTCISNSRTTALTIFSTVVKFYCGNISHVSKPQKLVLTALGSIRLTLMFSLVSMGARLCMKPYNSVLGC